MKKSKTLGDLLRHLREDLLSSEAMLDFKLQVVINGKVTRVDEFETNFRTSNGTLVMNLTPDFKYTVEEEPVQQETPEAKEEETEDNMLSHDEILNLINTKKNGQNRI